MSTLVVGSVRSSGATTLALAFAGWIDGAVLVEADPDGGVLALRYGLGREPGLLTLAAARDVDETRLLEHTQRLPGGLPVAVAPESAERSTHLLKTAGPRVAALLADMPDTTVIVDAGRLSPSSPALCFAAGAAAVVVVARSSAEALVAGAERVAALCSDGANAGLVLVGSGPYTATDAAQLGCVVLGTIADDARAARALTHGGDAKALTRSALARTARELATNLVAAHRPPALLPAADTRNHSEVSA